MHIIIGNLLQLQPYFLFTMVYKLQFNFDLLLSCDLSKFYINLFIITNEMGNTISMSLEIVCNVHSSL